MHRSAPCPIGDPPGADPSSRNGVMSSAVKRVAALLTLPDAFLARPLRRLGGRTGQPDDVARALAGAGADADLIDAETGLFEALGEARIGAGRPHRQNSPGLQGAARGGQTGLAVELVVGRAREPLRTIVDIQQDGVEARRLARDGAGDVALMDTHSGIDK